MSRLLKNDKKLYEAIRMRMNEILGDTLGNVNSTKKSPIFSNNDLISFSYVFEQDKNIYLYIKDKNGNIIIEIKDWENGRTESKFNVNMNEIKDIIIEMYEKITEKVNTKDILDTLFSFTGNTSMSNNRFGQEQTIQTDDMPF